MRVKLFLTFREKTFCEIYKRKLVIRRFILYRLAMSNTYTATARPYFTLEKSFDGAETLVEKRLNDLCGLRKEAAYYLRKDVACGPAYREVMRRIELEAHDLQYRVAMLIGAAEKLGQLLIDVEEKNGEYCLTLEENGRASEEFTISDARVLVEQAFEDIKNWEY